MCDFCNLVFTASVSLLPSKTQNSSLIRGNVPCARATRMRLMLSQALPLLQSPQPLQTRNSSAKTAASCSQRRGYLMDHKRRRCKGKTALKAKTKVKVKTKRKVVTKIESVNADDSMSSSSDVHNSLCQECGLGGDILLCDGCNLVYHTHCLVPPLKTIPEGDWFCPMCRPIRKRKRKRVIMRQQR